MKSCLVLLRQRRYVPQPKGCRRQTATLGPLRSIERLMLAEAFVVLIIWESWRKARPDAQRLPVIIPVVLAQNTEVWKISPQFASLLDIPAPLAADLSGFVTDFTFRLVQLAGIEFELLLR